MSPDAKDLVPDDSQLLRDITGLIKESKQRAVQQLNTQLTELYWRIGKRLSESVLGGERAAYGQQVIRDLSRELTAQHGRGWSVKQLHHCLRFAETFPDPEIVSALRRQLSWTHIKSLIYVQDGLKRDFYRQLAIQERWSTRTLAERMDSQLYERTAISMALYTSDCLDYVRTTQPKTWEKYKSTTRATRRKPSSPSSSGAGPIPRQAPSATSRPSTSRCSLRPHDWVRLRAGRRLREGMFVAHQGRIGRRSALRKKSEGPIGGRFVLPVRPGDRIVARFVSPADSAGPIRRRSAPGRF